MGRAPPQIACWRIAGPLCREVLASEVLTRVCVGFWAAFDRCRGSREAEPLARSVWIGHQDARSNVLKLLARSSTLTIDGARSLDRLRRAAERWSDLLLAPFASLAEVTDLAHDRARLSDFAQDAAEDRRRKEIGSAQRLWSRSRAEAFASCRRLATFNSDLNDQIAGSLLACFDLDARDELLTPTLSAIWRSLLFQRLSTTAADVQIWISGLLTPGNGATVLNSAEFD